MGKFRVPSAVELDEIRCCFEYEPETGAIFRKERKRNGALVGTRADHGVEHFYWRV